MPIVGDYDRSKLTMKMTMHMRMSHGYIYNRDIILGDTVVATHTSGKDKDGHFSEIKLGDKVYDCCVDSEHQKALNALDEHCRAILEKEKK